SPCRRLGDTRPQGCIVAHHHVGIVSQAMARNSLADTSTKQGARLPTCAPQTAMQGNPAARLRGSRNRLSEEVICALLRDFREHGPQAIANMRRTSPTG